MSMTWWQEYYDHIDNKRVDELEKLTADDVVLNMANMPPVEGVRDVMDGQREFLGSLESLTHNFVNTWEVDDTAILESVVAYVRRDGRHVDLPCVSVVHRSGEKVDSVRVYMDTAPLFAE